VLRGCIEPNPWETAMRKEERYKILLVEISKMRDDNGMGISKGRRTRLHETKEP
jgi:hypothetical protein